MQSCGTIDRIETVTARRLSSLFVISVMMASCATPTGVDERSVPPPPAQERVEEAPSSPSRTLSPQVGRAEEKQLKQEAEAKIEDAENVVKHINRKTLATDQQEILSTIQNFLSKAKKALTIKDFSRAYNLANKALILAQELSGTIR